MARTFLAAALAAATAGAQSFRLSNVLGDGMVLARGGAMVWGFAAPGTTVATTGAGANALNATTGSDGVWRQALPAQPAGGPATLTFAASTGESAALRDVLWGDVYLCGGQSNMQFTMASGFNASLEISRAANYPNIRLFTAGQGTSSWTPLTELGSIEQNWTQASPASVGLGNWTAFSAECWLFGRDLYDQLGGGVPIGLLSLNWGGTVIQAWVDNATVASCPAPPPAEDDAAGTLESGLQPASGLSSAGPGQNNVSVLYNSMIAPYTVGPFTLTGVIWHQGEQNWNTYWLQYSCLLKGLINLWRSDFGAPEMWFGVTVLQPWIAGVALHRLRDAQLLAVNALPNAAAGAAIDNGDLFSEFGSVHIRNKTAVAARLAAAALHQVYGHAELSAAVVGPNITSLAGSTAPNGDLVVTVSFDPASIAGGGIVVRDIDPATACPVAFGVAPNWCGWPAIGASTGDWVNATLSTAAGGTQLVFTAPTPAAGAMPVAVAYGHAPWPIVSVYSALSFDTGYESIACPLYGFNTTL